uniref:Uncharacterized protein n=1 Tax=Leersia perrieri TaxID=77586 RepID=A0A0D9XPQ7_9ORYZ
MSSPLASHETQEIESCFVVPSEKTPNQVLWLSPLDIVLSNRGGHTALVHFYRRDGVVDAAANGFFDVGRLKAAMARALVAFYPLAGRLRVNGDGRPEIDCNGEGVFFVVARSELTVDDAMSDLRPSPEFKRLFIPRIESPSPLVVAQVTFLRCGGVALGTAAHHGAVDGHSNFNFLQTWAAFCRDAAAATVATSPPCHDHTLIHARSPLIIHQDALHIFCPKLNLHDHHPTPTTTKILSISNHHLAILKSITNNASTYATVTALLWQCACAARRLPLNSRTRVRFPVNIRRLMNLPDHYFGNGVIEVCVSGIVKEIVSGTLADIAARIKAVMGRLNKDNEILRSGIDYHEISGMPDRPDHGSLPETELRVNSWLGIPLYDVDFGWGKAGAMSLVECSSGGYFYVMDGSGGGGGDVRVIVCMETVNLGEFERLLRAKCSYARI